MKIVRQIGIPYNSAPHQQIRAEFLEFCRQNDLTFDLKRDIYVDIEEADPRLKQLLGLLERHGFTPKPPHVKEMTGEDWNRYVLHNRYRSYDTNDLEACEYLLLGTTQESGYQQFNRHEGNLTFVGKRVPRWMRRADFAKDFYADLASDKAKRAIEAADLRGPRFSPVQYVPGYNTSDDNPVWWEIESDIHLPPTDAMEFVTHIGGRPVEPGDISGGLIVPRQVPGEPPPEWRYRRSVIESVGPFDFAQRFEPFGHKKHGFVKRRDTFVVSQRFYRVCRENNLEASWSPVRIEPG